MLRVKPPTHAPLGAASSGVLANLFRNLCLLLGWERGQVSSKAASIVTYPQWSRQCMSLAFTKACVAAKPAEQEAHFLCSQQGSAEASVMCI